MNQIILSGIQITISIWEMWMCYEILYMTVLDKKYADKKETIIRWANIFVVGSLLGINRLIAFFSRTMLGLVVILMLNVYKEEKDIQFSGTFFCENELQKQKRIDEVIEQIKEKDNHADILGVTEGEELYKNALYTKIQWRIVRGMCALVAILFFMINETIVLMAKAKKERKIMGINLALGATERDIKYCLFFETLLVTLLAVFLVMITLRPLAKLASLEHIIILDSMVIVETVILAVWACEILTWIIVSRIKKENIADMVRTTRDI